MIVFVDLQLVLQWRMLESAGDGWPSVAANDARQKERPVVCVI
jgi:hypothetical protein